MNAAGLAPVLLLMGLAPLVQGLVHRTRALITGRRGIPLLQLYRDLWKLARKGTVVSRTSSGLFAALPSAVLAAAIGAALLAPLGPGGSVLRFPGDFVAFAGLLALSRYALILAGFESGSSFEGMGASREVTIATFAEPALFLCLAALALVTGGRDMSSLFGSPMARAPLLGPALILVAGSLFVLLLAETGQVPVDDPTTHLELTMIHEVIVLDLGGPDLGCVLYAASLKLTLLAALIAAVLVPPGPMHLPWMVAGVAAIAVVVGVVAGFSARIRLDRLPQFLTAAVVLASLALALTLR